MTINLLLLSALGIFLTLYVGLMSMDVYISMKRKQVLKEIDEHCEAISDLCKKMGGL